MGVHGIPTTGIEQNSRAELKTRKAEIEDELLFTKFDNGSNETEVTSAEPEYENPALDEAEAAFDEAQENFNENMNMIKNQRVNTQNDNKNVKEDEDVEVTE